MRSQLEQWSSSYQTLRLCKSNILVINLPCTLQEENSLSTPIRISTTNKHSWDICLGRILVPHMASLEGFVLVWSRPESGGGTLFISLGQDHSMHCQVTLGTKPVKRWILSSRVSEAAILLVMLRMSGIIEQINPRALPGRRLTAISILIIIQASILRCHFNGAS